jgi:hypothetical protein
MARGEHHGTILVNHHVTLSGILEDAPLPK